MIGGCSRTTAKLFQPVHCLSEVGIIVAMYPSGQKHFFHLTTVYETHIIIIPPITIIIPSNFLHRLVAGGWCSCECVCYVCMWAKPPTQAQAKPSQAKPSLYPNQGLLLCRSGPRKYREEWKQTRINYDIIIAIRAQHACRSTISHSLTHVRTLSSAFMSNKHIIIMIYAKPPPCL